LQRVLNVFLRLWRVLAMQSLTHIKRSLQTSASVSN
jgi:hypothetical protein